jgi:hypothetical protein
VATLDHTECIGIVGLTPDQNDDLSSKNKGLQKISAQTNLGNFAWPTAVRIPGFGGFATMDEDEAAAPPIPTPTTAPTTNRPSDDELGQRLVRMQQHERARAAEGYTRTVRCAHGCPDSPNLLPSEQTWCVWIRDQPLDARCMNGCTSDEKRMLANFRASCDTGGF